MAKREPDVINVYRYWTAWVGSRRHGYSVGVVQHAERHLALRAARAKWPEMRITFVTES
jgi:hypothetical protein